MDSAKNIIYDIDNELDKIKFLNVVLQKNNSEYEKHKPVCTDPENCEKNYSYETIAYYLTQELNRLGVDFNGDTFSDSEKKEAENKLDEILSHLSELKAGQQVIYEDLTKEINELRELYFLGKKKWHQLLIGKSTEMIVSGIVGDTISKEIINIVKIKYPNLIE